MVITPQNAKYDIFISYKWNQYGNEVHKLRDFLAKYNYRIWIDKYVLNYGSLDKQMQDGIDESLIFICCVSEDYTNFDTSPNCGKEFNYAVSQGKPIIYVIFDDIAGLSQTEVNRKFNTVGFNMCGKLYYHYDPNNMMSILEAVQKNLDDIYTSRKPSKIIPTHWQVTDSEIVFEKRDDNEWYELKNNNVESKYTELIVIDNGILLFDEKRKLFYKITDNKILGLRKKDLNFLYSKLYDGYWLKNDNKNTTNNEEYLEWQAKDSNLRFKKQKSRWAEIHNDLVAFEYQELSNDNKNEFILYDKIRNQFFKITNTQFLMGKKLDDLIFSECIFNGYWKILT